MHILHADARMIRLPFAKTMPRITCLRGGTFAVLAGLIMTASIGCHGKPAASPSPPDVSVAQPVQKEVIEWDTYAGYLEAPESATVAARVSGLIGEMAVP